MVQIQSAPDAPGAEQCGDFLILRDGEGNTRLVRASRIDAIQTNGSGCDVFVNGISFRCAASAAVVAALLPRSFDPDAALKAALNLLLLPPPDGIPPSVVPLDNVGRPAAASSRPRRTKSAEGDSKGEAGTAPAIGAGTAAPAAG